MLSAFPSAIPSESRILDGVCVHACVHAEHLMHAYCLRACRPDGSYPRIYLKREDLNHTGAHKINNSLGQALLALRMGKQRIIAETGAGQHGVATVRATVELTKILPLVGMLETEIGQALLSLIAGHSLCSSGAAVHHLHGS